MASGLGILVDPWALADWKDVRNGVNEADKWIELGTGLRCFGKGS